MKFRFIASILKKKIIDYENSVEISDEGEEYYVGEYRMNKIKEIIENRVDDMSENERIYELWKKTDEIVNDTNFDNLTKREKYLKMKYIDTLFDNVGGKDDYIPLFPKIKIE